MGIPKGLCQCGCGRETNLALRGRKERGQIKGEPMAYISGHNGYVFPECESSEIKALKSKQWRENRKKERLCQDCPNKTNRTRCPECMKKRAKYMKNRLLDPVIKERNKVNAKEWKDRLRKAVIEGYGGICVCCGISVPEFLTLDHKNNDGAAIRKKEGHSAYGPSLYLRLIRQNFPDTFQLLCWNCNCSKGIFGNCPHIRRAQ